MGPTSDDVGESGIHGVALMIVRDLGWAFHAQRESDGGIDAIVEVKRDGRPTGEVFALQIKAGDARVAELRRKSRWRHYGRDKHHLSYWLAYQMQVIVVLYDQESHCAYWQPVNEETVNLTPQGFTIDVPAERRLTPDSKEELRALANRWVPHRGSQLERILREVGFSRQLGIPVPPTTQLWNQFALHNRGNGAAALTYGLPLIGDALAVHLTADRSQPASVTFDDLSGLWGVPAETTVFVAENPLVVEAAGRQLADHSHGVVALGGFPSTAVQYLLVGLGCAGASLYLHTDHDSTGEQIADSLLMRNVTFEPWCPNPAKNSSKYEEECLPWMLRDIARS